MTDEPEPKAPKEPMFVESVHAELEACRLRVALLERDLAEARGAAALAADAGRALLAELVSRRAHDAALQTTLDKAVPLNRKPSSRTVIEEVTNGDRVRALLARLLRYERALGEIQLLDQDARTREIADAALADGGRDDGTD